MEELLRPATEVTTTSSAIGTLEGLRKQVLLAGCGTAMRPTPPPAARSSNLGAGRVGCLCTRRHMSPAWDVERTRARAACACAAMSSQSEPAKPAGGRPASSPVRCRWLASAGAAGELSRAGRPRLALTQRGASLRSAALALHRARCSGGGGTARPPVGRAAWWRCGYDRDCHGLSDPRRLPWHFLSAIASSRPRSRSGLPPGPSDPDCRHTNSRGL